MALITYHDDWLMHVYLDGHGAYTFNTEMWQHGDSSNWNRVTREAIARAEDLLKRGDKGYIGHLHTDTLRVYSTVEQYRKAANGAFMVTDDYQFRRFIYR